MGIDVKFSRDEGSFKLRVCGVIISNGKILIERGEDSNFWGYPGGHVELGEDTRTAVVREVYEETKIETQIVKTLANIQLFFPREDRKPFHEIGYYYLLKSKNELPTKDFSVEEIDKGEKKKHDFKWVTFDELKQIDLRPVALKDVIINHLENQEIIYYSED